MRVSYALAAAVLALAPAAAMADTTAYNATPTDTWYFGTNNSNAYSPANTVVLTTTANDQLYLRWHVTHFPAPSAPAGSYQFQSNQFNLAAGDSLSFDWGVDTTGTGLTANGRGGYTNLTVQLTATNLGTGQSASYNAFDPIGIGLNDNELKSGSVQNSARLTFPFLSTVNFDPAVNDTYRIDMSVGGLTGGTKTLSALAVVGTGAAVPEAATWAMMLGGFGMVGGALRRRRTAVRFA